MSSIPQEELNRTRIPLPNETIEPSWSINARRRGGAFAIDCLRCAPNDPRVREAKALHLDFNTPIGVYLWDDETQSYHMDISRGYFSC